MSDKCHELNSIKYKTMLMQGEITSPTETILNIEEILDKESAENKLEPWCKLDKTIKLNKLSIYANLLTKKHNLLPSEEKDLLEFLSSSLDKKLLSRVKEVQYDKEVGIIKNIPQLTFNNTTKKFFLKKSDKHVSTTKSLSIKKNCKTLEKPIQKLAITDD